MSEVIKNIAALHDDDVITTEEAAQFLGLSTSSLNKSRLTGDTPTFLKLGRAVRYRVGDLREWLGTKRRRSTSEYSPRVRAAS